MASFRHRRHVADGTFRHSSRKIAVSRWLRLGSFRQRLRRRDDSPLRLSPNPLPAAQLPAGPTLGPPPPLHARPKWEILGNAPTVHDPLRALLFGCQRATDSYGPAL